MKKLILALLLFVSGVNAQVAGPSKAIQYNNGGTLGASNKFTYASATGIVTAPKFEGEGTSLTIVTGTVSQTLVNILTSGGHVCNVVNYGAVCDAYLDSTGAVQGTDSLPAFKRATQACASNTPAIVYVPACGMRYKLGSNAATNVELPWQISASSLWFVGENMNTTRLVHNLNRGSGALIQPANEAETDTGTRYSNVGIENFTIEIPGTGSISTNKKAINNGHYDTFTMRNILVSNSALAGSFNFTNFHVNNFLIENIWCDGNSIGQDCMHQLGNTYDGQIKNIFCGPEGAGDDCISFTQENSNFSTSDMHDIIVDGVTGGSHGFSCFKFYNQYPTTAKIHNIFIDNYACGPASNGQGSKLLTIDPGSGAGVYDIKFGQGTGSGVGLGASNPVVDIEGGRNIDLGAMQIRDCPARCFYAQSYNGLKIGPSAYIGGGATSITTIITSTNVVSASAYQSSNGLITFTTDGLVSLTTSSGDFAQISGFVTPTLNGWFSVSSVNDPSHTVAVTGPIGFTNALLGPCVTSCTLSIVKRGGNLVTNPGTQINGGVGLTIIDSTFDTVNSQAILLAGNPSNTKIINNLFKNQYGSAVIDAQAASGFTIDGNTCVSCTTNYFIYDEVTSNGGLITNNIEISGTVLNTSRLSYRFVDVSSTTQNNKGTNSDIRTGLITVAAGATSATLNVPLTFYAKFTAADVSPDLVVNNNPIGAPISGTMNVSYSTTLRQFYVSISPTSAAAQTFRYNLTPYRNY